MDEKKLTETETSAPEVMDAASAYEIVYHYKGIYRPAPAAEETEKPTAPAEVGDIVYTDVYTAKDGEDTASDAVIGTIAPAPAEEKPEFIYNEKLIKKNKRAAEAKKVAARTRAFAVMSLVCGACGVVMSIFLGYVGILLGVFALCFRSVTNQLSKGEKDVITVIGLVTGLVAIAAGAGMTALRYLVLLA